MRIFKIFIPVLIICVIFSGCSFRIASSVDDLISPVPPSGDNENVQNALNSYCKDGYSLKTPAGGEHTTAYTFFDYDNDGADEAVVFYEPASSLGSINMALIDKQNESWSVVCNIEGEGADIYSVDFIDLNGDEVLEFIVLWDTISNSSNHIMSIYRQSKSENEIKLTKSENSVTMNDYIAADIDDDNKNELVVFSIQSGDSMSASAVLYYYADDSLKSLGSTKLDGHINSYKSIKSEKFNDTVYIYADAVKSNGTEMLTEIIHWSDYYNTIVSPFYSYSTGITKRTTRSAMLSSRDINGDGKIDIPLDAEIETPSGVAAVNWKRYENTVLEHTAYSLAVEKDDYQLVIPDDVFDKIKIQYDSSKALLTVTDENDKLVFNVLTVLKSQYTDNSVNYNASGYSVIGEEFGYVYLTAAGSESEISFNTEDLKGFIKPYKGE